MNKEKCVVLVSKNGYRDKHLDLLRNWIDTGISLFCAVGKDCEIWEQEMDRLCVLLDTSGEKPGAFCVTTSHPEETVDAVIEFASNWNFDRNRKCEVEVTEI